MKIHKLKDFINIDIIKINMDQMNGELSINILWIIINNRFKFKMFSWGRKFSP